MHAEYDVLDVFTDTPLTGNQLAVFHDGSSVPDRLLQDVAREIGFSETVYVYDDDRIRIFTPADELAFAGHPVLGTAYALATQRGVREVALHPPAGEVVVRFDDGWRGRFERAAPEAEPVEDPAPILRALGVARSEVPVEAYVNGPRHLYVVLASTDAVAALAPDHGALARVAVGCGISCVAGSGRAWKSRVFGAGVGVIEDPATGSAAGPLALHLARHELIGWGEEITITQGVELRRPSTLFATARTGVLEVAGDTVSVGRGVFEL